MPSDLLDRLQRILPLADKVADEIVCGETATLENIVPRMFEIMQTTVKYLCDYVKRGRFGMRSSALDWKILMIAERTKDGLINSRVKEVLEKMDRELTKVIEDFLRAVDVEALYQAKKTGKYPSFQYGNSSSSFSIASYRGGAFAWTT